MPLSVFLYPSSFEKSTKIYTKNQTGPKLKVSNSFLLHRLLLFVTTRRSLHCNRLDTDKQLFLHQLLCIMRHSDKVRQCMDSDRFHSLSLHRSPDTYRRSRSPCQRIHRRSDKALKKDMDSVKLRSHQYSSSPQRFAQDYKTPSRFPTSLHWKAVVDISVTQLALN